MAMELERELELARSLAERAGEVALTYQKKGVSVETKADASPVTVADRECERLISAALEEAFPDDGLLGEEGCDKASRSGRRWIIDPIDGTCDYVRGNRMWGVLLALEAGGEVVAGICRFPALEETYSAARGRGAYLNDTRIRVSAISEPAQAVLCLNDLHIFNQCPFAAGLLDWMAQFWIVRNMGGCPDAMLVASGKAEAWIEPRAKPWDLAPAKIITEEAGGRFFNFDGGGSIYGGNCVTCAPGLEAELRRFVAG